MTHAVPAPLVVAIDGPAGAGKSTLTARIVPLIAEALGATVPVVHMDDIYNSWEDGPTGGAARLAELILTPWAEDRPAVYRRYDWHAGGWGDQVTVGPGPVAVVEGCGAGAGALRAAADHPALRTIVVWIEPADDADAALERAIARDGESQRAGLELWARLQSEHYAAERTPDRADVVAHHDGAGSYRLDMRAPTDEPGSHDDVVHQALTQAVSAARTAGSGR